MEARQQAKQSSRRSSLLSNSVDILPSIQNKRDQYKPYEGVSERQQSSQRYQSGENSITGSQSVKQIKIGQSKELSKFMPLDTTLIKAKQHKFQTQKDVHAKQSRMLVLQREEEKYLKKFDFEIKKQENIVNIRNSFNDEMNKFRNLSMEKTLNASQSVQNNLHIKETIQKNIQQRAQMIYEAKKMIRDDVYEQKKKFVMDRKKFEESYNNEKLMKAQQLKMDLQNAKAHKELNIQKKDKNRKLRYIQRVNEEKDQQHQMERTLKQLDKREQEMLERVKMSQIMVKKVARPVYKDFEVLQMQNQEKKIVKLQ